MPKPPRPRMTKLAFAPWEYNPQALQRRSIRELKREYSRLRTIANKRLARLMDSEFADSQAVAYNAGRYVPIKGITSESELRHLLTDLSKFITSEQSTVTGQRDIVERLTQTWRDDKGFDFINTGNVRDWVRFLDYVQDVEGYVYDIAAMGEAFEEMSLDVQRGYTDRMEIRDVYDYYKEKTSR